MTWKLEVRDATGARITEIKDYKSANLKPVFRDVGTWTVILDRDAPAVSSLLVPGSGLVASRDGVVVLSGPANNRKHEVSDNLNQITVSGFTDEIWLKRRLAHPSPTEASAPFTQEFDERTGQASSVLLQYVDMNAGPGALAPRRVTALTVAADPALGSTVSGKGRFENLLTFLQPLALSGGVGFRVAQVGTALQFQVWAPQDLSATVKFAVGLKNLRGFTYEHTAPDGNAVYIGGTGDGVARAFTEASDAESITEWGRIEGDLVDARSTTDATQIAQEGTDALTQHGEQASLSIQPIEVESNLYGVHYGLGDTVAVLLDGPVRTPYAESNQIVDQLRSVEISLTPDGGTVITPSLGTPARGDIGRIFRVVSAIKSRVINLETRK